jgi:hypothetical protein
MDNGVKLALLVMVFSAFSFLPVLAKIIGQAKKQRDDENWKREQWLRLAQQQIAQERGLRN